MNNMERNSMTYYNKMKREVEARRILIQKQKEKFNEKLKSLKTKKWQGSNYNEELKKEKEKEKIHNSNLHKNVSTLLVSKEAEGAKESPNNEELKIKKHKVATHENAIVSYNLNQNKHLDYVHQKMLYIQYLLNTFEMYPEFNIHYYRNNNNDIKHLSNYELVYHWNHYGINEKHKRVYNYDTFMEYNSNFYKEYPIYIFMHVCNLHNGIQIFYEQLNSIVESGLYDKCKNILVCIVGKKFEIPSDKYSKLLLLYQDDNPKYYEVKTINYIKYIAERVNPNARILYVHTKGVRKNGDEVCVRSWRKLLEHWIVTNHDICLQYLINYDSVGSNVINMSPSTGPENQYLFYVNPNHFFHYSGNFWWTTAKHVSKLPLLLHNPNKHAVSTRCRAENWILSGLPHMRGFEIYYNKSYVHPYNTYCDPKSYQKPYIEIFTGRNNFEMLKD
jgi:hypothetical protein